MAKCLIAKDRYFEKSKTQAYRLFTDIYESPDAVYIVTDLCTGGELFQRIVERGLILKLWLLTWYVKCWKD